MRRGGLLALFVCLTSGCSNEVQPTRAQVDVYGDFGGQLATLQVEVSDLDDAQLRRTETFPVAASRDPSNPELLFQFAIAPHPGREGARFLVSVTGLDASGKFVVQARAIDRFLRGARVNVSIKLESKCTDVECPDTTTTCSADVLDEHGRGRCTPIAAADAMVQDASQIPSGINDAGAETQSIDAKDASHTEPSGSDAASRVDAEVEGSSGAAFVVTGTTPQNGGMLETGMSAVRIALSRAVDDSSVTSQGVRLSRDDQAVAATIKMEDGQIVLIPSQPFPLGATFRVDLTADIRSTDGATLTPSSFEFQIREGVWATEFASISTNGEVHVGVAPGGNALVAYTGPVTAGREVWTSRYAPGTGWSTPQKISTSTEPRLHSRVAVTINDAGHAVVAWDHNDYVWYTVFDRQWSSEVRLGEGYAPDVVLLSSDNWYLVSQQNSVEGYKIAGLQGSVGSGGTTSSTLSSIGATIKAFDYPPRLAPIGSSAMAVWSEDRANSSYVVGGRWESAGSAQALSAPGAASEYRISADPARQSAIAVWQQTDVDWTNIWAARIIDGGSFGESVPISNRTSTTSRPDVALDAAGRAIAVWEQAAGGIMQVAAARYTPGQGWSPPEFVSDVTLPSGGIAWPVVAMEPGGNAIAAWVEVDETDSALIGVWVARYRLGQGWIAAERRVVSSEGKAANQRPSIGVDLRGRAVLGFVEAGEVRIARFD